MRVGDKDFYEMLADFDRMVRKEFYNARTDKEPKDLWIKGIIYQDGKVNELFKAFRLGYAYAQQRQLEHE